MEDRFDSLAKSVSGAMSRREAFWRLGSGLALGVLALFGLGSARQDDPCAHVCVITCINLHSHPTEAERGACISSCIKTTCQAG